MKMSMRIIQKLLVCILLLALFAFTGISITHAAYEPPKSGNGWSISEDMTLTIEDNDGWQDYLWNGSDDDFKCVFIGKGLTDFELFDEFEHPRQTAPYQPEYICPLLNPDTILVEDGNPVFYMDGGCLINSKTHKLVLSEADIRQAVIPDGVIGVTSYAFYRREQLESVIMPDTVTTIENNAFDECIQLSTVRFSDHLKEIGDFAFADTSVNELQFPATLTSIGNSAFTCCRRIETIDMSNLQLDQIACYLFSNCTALRRVTLMSSLRIIQYGAFEGCTNLSVIELHQNTQRIELGAFHECSFQIIKLPSGISLDGDSRFLDFELETDEYRFSTVGLAVFDGEVSVIGKGSFDICDRVIFYENPPDVVEEGAFAVQPKAVYYLDEFSSVWSPNDETEWNGWAIQQITRTEAEEMIAEASQPTPSPTADPTEAPVPPAETPTPTPIPTATPEPEQTGGIDGTLLAFGGAIVVVIVALIVLAVRRRKI